MGHVGLEIELGAKSLHVGSNPTLSAKSFIVNILTPIAIFII